MNTNDYVKKFMLGGDARSTRGILSRGKNVYKGGSPHARTPDLRKAARRKLRNMK